MRLRLYLADMVEPQANGKLAVLGLYSDLVIVLNVPPGSPDPTPEAAFGTDMCLMLTLSDMRVGPANGEMQVFAPGIESTPVMKVKFSFPIPEDGASANLPIALRPLPVPALGIYTVEVRIGTEVLIETFEVRVRIDPAAPPPMLLAPADGVARGAVAEAPALQPTSAP